MREQRYFTTSLLPSSSFVFIFLLLLLFFAIVERDCQLHLDFSFVFEGLVVFKENSTVNRGEMRQRNWKSRSFKGTV